MSNKKAKARARRLQDLRERGIIGLGNVSKAKKSRDSQAAHAARREERRVKPSLDNPRSKTQSIYFDGRDQKPAKQQKKPNGFYQSEEWLSLRYRALKLNGAACQCCGATRRDGVKLHVDHIKPRSKFPELALSLSNLQVLCEPCNLGKGVWDQTDWRNHPPRGDKSETTH